MTIARLGGDEFVILARAGPAENAPALAERVLALMGPPFECNGNEIFCNASIGLALGRESYTTPEEVLRDADIAMDSAKAAGKGRCSIFQPAMSDAAVNRLRLENDLRRAIERRELVVHYQPIVDLRHGGVRGFEALVRWQRADQLVSPAEFVPVAEEIGQIIPLGRWVMQEACRQVAQWRRAVPGLERCYVSVNLSSCHFAVPDLVGDVTRCLAPSGLEPSALVLEITESAIMDDPDGAVATLQRLRAAGVRVDMDDFGTGYSSLSFLKQLPLQGLKVDRSFVQQMEGNHDGAAIIHAIVTLARNLRMNITAEGVETPAQLAAILAFDCDQAQGYIFSPPLEAARIPSWVAQFPDRLSGIGPAALRLDRAA